MASDFIALLVAVQCDAEIVVYPPEVRLQTPESSQQLIVQRKQGDEVSQQLVDGVKWKSADESVAKVNSDGVITPVGNGETSIQVAAGDQNKSIPVKVAGVDQEFRWDFRKHVLPILTKAGCNMGACHGALAGKGGFRLSLRGYDPLSDYFNIVKQDRGRRIEFADPGRSLILSKPTGAIPHKGGLRLDKDSDDYRILAEWIAHGAQAPQEDDAVVESISLFPERVQLKPGQTQQLIVQAHSTDEHTEDVTRWTKWTSTNDAVCTVDDQGNVTVVGPGEGAIMAWFSSKIAIARITVPYDNMVDPKVFAELKPKNFIDEEVDRQLKRLNLPPSPPATDATFIRRVYLDTLGLLPTDDEVQEFLANSAEDKRDKLIGQLLDRPEFVDYWTYKWSDVLMLNGTLLRPTALKAYYEFIHENVEKNRPWNEFVYDILTSTGDTYTNGATNFYSLYESPEDMTENACQAFLGLSIGCAKCHNHPLEKWTNDQYYAMANLFSRVKMKGWGGERRNGDGLRTVYVADHGDLTQPRTGKPQPPTPLDAEPLPFDATQDRRIALAEWLTSAENPYFARSVTNRIWANYFGVGLVEQVDDMRVSNPASNEQLLDRTAKYLVDNKFNVKSLMKEILRSNTYQRSSEPLEGNAADERFYSRYFSRRLTAEVLHDAIFRVTDVPTTFDSVGFPGGDKQKTDFYPVGTRAVQLYDSAVESYFLKTFGRNTRNIVCECERSNEPSMVQVLHMSNGDTLNDKLAAKDGRVAKLVAQYQNGLSAEALVDQAYLLCLARYPRPDERQRFVAIIIETSGDETRLAIEDLFWALMTSREFVFNH